jgi:uncharacterized protein
VNFNLLLENLSNPALLFFVLGVIAAQLKSDLEIPPNSSKFISLYLLFAIGFKGGVGLAHSEFSLEIIWALLFGMVVASLIPLYTFFILKKKLSIENSGAIAAAYGSVSAVTFVAAITFLEMQKIEFNGYMVAVMALMEAPAIIVGLLLIKLCSSGQESSMKISKVVQHSFTNGSVILILGSLVVGFLTSDQQAAEIKPFTTDIFKGFLAIFLLDMGLESGRKLNDFIRSGWFTSLFAIFIPLINGCLTAYASGWLMNDSGDRFLMAVLAASASYIAVPAAMKIAVPKANAGIYLPMALAVTFPVNLTLGMPLYMLIVLL